MSMQNDEAAIQLFGEFAQRDLRLGRRHAERFEGDPFFEQYSLVDAGRHLRQRGRTTTVSW